MDFSNKYVSNIKSGSLEYLQFTAFNESNLVNHCVTTRNGGVSSGELQSLNLKFGTGDLDENILKNREIICNELKIDANRLVGSNQPHGDQVRIVDQDSVSVDGYDGFITNVPGVPLVTYYADCVPLLFLDPVNKVIANSHAGWRGTVKKIGQKTVNKMKEEFGCRLENILVGIGPSIGQCCFETDRPVVEEFNKSFENGDKLYKPSGDKYYIDLWEANKAQLIEVGVRSENIFTSGICTMCNKDKFFSYRAENGKTGRIGAIIQLK